MSLLCECSFDEAPRLKPKTWYLRGALHPCTNATELALTIHAHHRNQLGATPLHGGSLSGSADCVLDLLASGADIHAVDEVAPLHQQRPPLCSNQSQPHGLLQSPPPRATQPHCTMRVTVATFASLRHSSREAPTCQLSIMYGITFCLPFAVLYSAHRPLVQNGDTPLHVASAHGRLNCVQVLLKAGADVNARAKVL